MVELQSRRRIAVPLVPADPRGTPVDPCHEAGLGVPAHAATSRGAAARSRDQGRRLGSGVSSTVAEQELREAIQRYQKESGRKFPTWSEVLEVLQGLGYRKVGEESPA